MCNKFFKNKIGMNIRRFRKKEGLTVMELANKTKCSRSHIYKIEEGFVSATVSSFYKLSKALNVSLSDIFKGVK